MTFKKGSLWHDLIKTYDTALRSGALLPIPTDQEFMEDSRIRFLVRILSTLSRKDKAKKHQEEAAAAGKEANPFLPYEKELYVADIADTHVAVLNKFNVVDHHLLIITRYFEDQETYMTLKDFEALWLCMAEYNGLGFYNGGREAGASQPHKHIQLVPLPLAPEGPAVPVDPLLPKAVARDGFGTITAFPFLHSFVRIDPNLVDRPLEAARETFALYSTMLQRVGMEKPAREELKRQSMPYCLIVTREWMLLVPRSREFFEGISFNSLAYAGSLFVRDEQQIERLKAYGPLNALSSVAIARDK